MLKRLSHKIERIFLAGLVVLLPTMITVFLLKFLMEYIDRVSAPVVSRLFHVHIPGIGLIVTLLIVFGIGLIGANFLGRKFVSLGERMLTSIPVVNSIYSLAKQVIETVIFATQRPFQQVVLVPYPHRGTYAIGLVTHTASVTPGIAASPPAAENCAQPQMITVFIPSTPNFTSGLLVMYPPHDVIPIAMSVEEGFKYLLTGGILPTTPTATDLQKAEEWDLFLW